MRAAALPRDSYRRRLRALPAPQVGALWQAAHDSLAGFADATAQHGSLLQSWVRGAAVQEHAHYPHDDVVDLARGSQFFYHAHRAGSAEHGHVHLFWHATAGARRRYARGGRQRWVRSAPTHLFAVGLDAKGLPVSLFTVNRWVTGGHWFNAGTLLGMVRRFHVEPAGRHAASCRWANGFVRMYEPLVAELLRRRDAALHRAAGGDVDGGAGLERVLADERREVLSHVALDWARDLDALERHARRCGVAAAV